MLPAFLPPSTYAPVRIAFDQRSPPLPANLVIGEMAKTCICLLGEPNTDLPVVPVRIGVVQRWTAVEGRVTLWCSLDRQLTGEGAWGVAALYITTRGVSLTHTLYTDPKGRVEDEVRVRERPAVLEGIALMPLAHARHRETSPATLTWLVEGGYAAR